MPDNRRFTLQLNDEAVVDNETGLTWQRTPDSATSWLGAIGSCLTLITAGRSGWRLPTISELTTLAMQGQTPAFPAGHPFNLGATPPSFWSQTIYGDTTSVVSAHFSGPGLAVTVAPKTSTYRVLCVRTPTNGSDR